MCGLKENPQRPWLCCGDFNEILDASEKIGGVIRPFWQIDNFRHAVEECGLYPFSFSGYEFTWDNRRVGVANVKERIDRSFGNLLLLQQWGGFTSHHLVAMSSDHCPLLIENDLVVVDDEGGGRRRRRFMFEEMWTHDEECGRVIDHGWKDLGNLHITRKLSKVAEELKVWGKEKFGSVRRTIQEFRHELDVLQRLTPTEDVIKQRGEMELKLDKLLE